jgi:hypothetical protein
MNILSDTRQWIFEAFINLKNNISGYIITLWNYGDPGLN